jgi:hypothetical protein
MDKSLNDDMLKLVRYKILFVKREYEHAFKERESLVWENVDGSTFAGWKIAEFIQELDRRETVIPEGWRSKSYPPEKEGNDKDGRIFRAGDKLLGFPEGDKKYLRVFFEVLERYPREKFRHEERQIEVLEEIRDRMSKPKEGEPASGEKPAAGKAGSGGGIRVG